MKMLRRRPVRIIAWNLGIAIALLVLVELAMGNWFRDDPLRPLAIPRDVSWRYEIDYPGIREDDRAVHYVRDRYGLRGNYGRPAEIDILTVGGSTTDQRFVTEVRTWQDVLMTEFRKVGLDIRVANAGINGRTTYGHLHDFDLWFPRIEGLAPAWVVLYVGINDMFADRPTRYDSANRRDESPWRHVRDNSVILETWRTLSGMLRARRFELAGATIDHAGGEWTTKPLMSGHRERMAERIAGFRARLAALLDRVERMGATPIVVTQPRGDSRIVDGEVVGLADTRPRAYLNVRDPIMGVLRPGTANGVDYHLMLEPFNEASLEICRRAGGVCIDLAGELRFEAGDFYDHAHTTAAGSRRIGEYLFDKLAPVLAGGAERG